MDSHTVIDMKTGRFKFIDNEFIDTEFIYNFIETIYRQGVHRK